MLQQSSKPKHQLQGVFEYSQLSVVPQKPKTSGDTLPETQAQEQAYLKHG